jgi:polysaccharide deacetylase family protein (PEP-CTERM system associated)
MKLDASQDSGDRLIRQACPPNGAAGDGPAKAHGVVNALSIDLEDWFCVQNLAQVIRRDDWDRQEQRVAANTERLLALLSRRGVTATFFVLGWVARRRPDLVAEIEKQGHEIGTHGYSHRLLTEMTPESFERDLCEALEVTQKCVRQPILGFRAPSFTVTKETLWALDILVRNGIRYDSSIFPFGLHPDYGMADAPLGIHRLRNSLIEFPLSCAELFGRRVPCSGGGYFRLFPYSVTKFLLNRCNDQGRPVIFYLHPWEIDPGQPRVKLPAAKAFRHYHNLDKALGRLDRLLGDFQFTSAKGVLGL